MKKTYVSMGASPAGGSKKYVSMTTRTSNNTNLKTVTGKRKTLEEILGELSNMEKDDLNSYFRELAEVNHFEPYPIEGDFGPWEIEIPPDLSPDVIKELAKSTKEGLHPATIFFLSLLANKAIDYALSGQALMDLLEAMESGDGSNINRNRNPCGILLNFIR